MIMYENIMELERPMEIEHAHLIKQLEENEQ